MFVKYDDERGEQSLTEACRMDVESTLDLDIAAACEFVADKPGFLDDLWDRLHPGPPGNPSNPKSEDVISSLALEDRSACYNLACLGLLRLALRYKPKVLHKTTRENHRDETCVSCGDSIKKGEQIGRFALSDPFDGASEMFCTACFCASDLREGDEYKRPASARPAIA